MILKPITEGALNGSAGVKLTDKNRLFGGVVLSTDGTNAGVVTVREKNSSGKIIFYLSSKTPGVFIAPVLSSFDELHLTVSGTNAVAMFYEWIY